MRLPNLERAKITTAKLLDYLLDPEHPDGKGKAVFFLRFGFSANNFEVLRIALVQHAMEHKVDRVEVSPFGKRYIIDGAIRAPDGRRPLVRVVWFIEAGADVPRLVTAYPLKRSIP